MKKILTLSCLLFLAGAVVSQNYKVERSDYSQVKLSFSTPDIDVEEITLMGNLFCTITLDGFGQQSTTGNPALPSMVKSIEVPLGNGLGYEVLSMECDTINGELLGIGRNIVPAQPSRSKSDGNTNTLVMDRATYANNSFCGEPTIVLEEMGVARNRNLATIAFNPISWNPVTNQVAIVRSITVTVRQRNADIEATKRMKGLYASGEYGYGIEAINNLPNGTKEARSGAPIRYTIVAHSMFRGELDEFAVWKRRKGFLVDLVYTDEPTVGSTTTSISGYLKGLYDNATESEPAPTYVLLVGDVAQIPAFQLSTQNSHYSDLNYVCWSTGDQIPDCYIGRFSAQSLEQLTPQISKTLLYEQYTFPDDSYLNKAVLIAGVDGGSNGDFGYTHADPTMDYIAHNYINSDNGFTTVTYYKNKTSQYPEGVTVSGSSQASATASALRSLYNNGVGWANYSAHGDKTNWSSPSLTVTNVEQMTNYNMPMIAIGNCCLTNSFQIGTCLGEAFLRKDRNAGGVAYIGASEVTYWDEDVYWAMGVRTNISASMSIEYNASNLGMYDQLFHTHGEDFSQWHISMGAMLFAGNMAVQSSTSSTAMKKYYWEVYHLMGDPSLMPYIHGAAQTMNITAEDVIPLGQNTINVQCVPYAYVAMTNEEHELVAASYADATGNAVLTLSNADNIETGDYEIAASAQGYKSVFMPVTIMPIGTYVKATAMEPTGTLEAGKPIAFNLTLNNIGVEAADNLWIEFRNTDNMMLIDTTGLTNLNRGLNADGELVLNSRCHTHIWDDVEDQALTSITVIIKWAQSDDISTRSISRFTFPVNAAKINTESQLLTIDSNNNGQLTIESINMGHSTLVNARASLVSLDPSIIVQGNDASFNIPENVSVSRIYNISSNENEPINRVVPMLYTIANDDYQFTDSLNIVFGEPYQFIDFEDGTWNEGEWNQGNYPWEITSTNPYEGNYCMRSKSWSGNEGNRKSSETSISFTTTHDDSVSFYYRVSTEENYDNFNFYIDNNLTIQASGEVDWSRVAFFVAPGTHTLRFVYAKDYYISSGEDAVFVDNLKLPLEGFGYVYLNDTICCGTDYTFLDTTISTESLGEGTHHFTFERDNNIYNLTLTTMPVPQVAIEGGNVTIVAGEAVRLTATGGSRYLWNNGEHHNVIDVYPTTTTTFTVTAFNGRCNAEASTTITIGGAAGIEDDSLPETLGSQLKVYPNPTHDKIAIEAEGLSVIIITDITGRVEKKVVCNGDNRASVDISNLANGIHMIQVTSTDGNKTVKKIIKQ